MSAKSVMIVLEEIGALLSIKGENPFKTRAYYNAAKALASVDDLESLIQEKRLREIKGIGDAIAAKIEEYATTGTMAYYEDLKAEVPISLLELLQIPNLGEKKIRALYEKLNIRSIGELEDACKENRLLTLTGFGEKAQQKILKGIEFVRQHTGEYLLGEIYPLARGMKEKLQSAAKNALIEICGSIRRRKEIVRDIDILVAGENVQNISSVFIALPDVRDVIASGETKTSCRLTSGIEADLRIVSAEEFPYALMYFTGSKEHNVKLRGIAKRKGLKLNEYGLFRDETLIRCRDEAEVYGSLDLSYVPPELREDIGEVEAAQSGMLPKLIELNCIRGLFHIHTDYSDGADSLEKIVALAKRMGLSYIGITDHSKTAAYAGGLKVDKLRRQWELIDLMNENDPAFRILKGIESDILSDGRLDYDEEVLKRFDFVIGSVHSQFNLPKEEQERRIITAMKNPYMTMLGHPTGRLLLSRNGYEVDMRTIIEAAAETHTIIELNASPYRFDIDWRYMKHAKEKGVMISINPDAHSAAELGQIAYGVDMARKGWQEPADILNTRTTSEVAAILRRKRQ